MLRDQIRLEEKVKKERRTIGSLKRLVALFAKPDSWVQGVAAVDADGNPADPSSDEAVKWDLYFACLAVKADVRDIFTPKDGGIFNTVTSWNDDPARTIADVRKLLKGKLVVAEAAYGEHELELRKMIADRG